MDISYNTADKIAGAFAGFAAGDVLGAPLEGMVRKTIKTRFGTVREILRLPCHEVPDRYHWRLPGLHTDDTQQVLTLTDCLLECGEINEDYLKDVWGRMAGIRITIDGDEEQRNGSRKRTAVNTFGCHRGTGGKFRKYIRSDQRSPSAGIGAAMRALPIGLSFRENDSSRIHNAIKSALMINSHPHGAASAVAMASFIAYAVKFPGIAPKVLLRMVVEDVQSAEKLLQAQYSHFMDEPSRSLMCSFSTIMQNLIDIHDAPFDQALEMIVIKAESILEMPGLYASKGLAATALPTAIVTVLSNMMNFEQGVVAAINLGGDADTIGALTGAGLGALLGFSAIPERWTRGILAFEIIQQRAQALAANSRRGEWISLVDEETRLTRTEEMQRNRLGHEIREYFTAQDGVLNYMFVDVEDGMDQNAIRPCIEKQLLRISTSKRFQDNADHSRIYLRYKMKKIAIFSWYHSSKKLLSEQGNNFQAVHAAEHYVFKIGFAYDRNTLKQVFNAEEGDVLAQIIPGQPFEKHVGKNTGKPPSDSFELSLEYYRRCKNQSFWPA